MDGTPSSVPSMAALTVPGVRDVVAEVRAAVDARHEQRRLLGQDRVDREVHAVGRRAVDGVAVRPGVVDAQRPMQRERMAARALLPVRRDDDDVADRCERSASAARPAE